MTAPGQPVDTVYVEVLASFDRFAQSLLLGIEKEMLKLRAEVAAIMRGIEADTDRGFHRIGNAMTRNTNRASRDVNLALRAISNGVSDLGEAANKGFREVSNGAGIIGNVFSGPLSQAFGDVQKAATALFSSPVLHVAFYVALGLAIIPLIGVIASLGSSLVQLVGLIGLVPAGLTTAVATFAPLIIAFHGFGEAVAAAFGDDPEKFKQALKGLTPAAQEIVKDIAALKKPFTDLRRVVQEAFFSPLVDDVDNFTKNLFQPLQNGLVIVARQLGGLLSDVLGKLSSPGGARFLTELFQTTADILASMRPAITALAVGFGKVALAAFPIIERLSGSFAKALTDFGNFLSRSAESGALETFIQDALDVAKQFGALFGSVGNFFGALFNDDAQEGGQKLLDILTKTFNDIANFLRSPAGQDFLKFLIEDTKEFGKALLFLGAIFGIVLIAITEFFGAVIEISKPITDFIVGLEKDFLDFEKTVIDAFTGLPAKIEKLGGALFAAGAALVSAFFGGFKAGGFFDEVAGTIVAKIKSFLNATFSRINSGLSELDGVLGIFGVKPLRLPQLASGGLALGPSIVGEAGRELAVPLNDPQAQEAIRQALGGAMGGVTIGPGAVQVSFEGVVPTRQQAYDVGAAVAQGLADAMARRDARTLARLA